MISLSKLNELRQRVPKLDPFTRFSKYNNNFRGVVLYRTILHANNILHMHLLYITVVCLKLRVCKPMVYRI